MLIEIFVGILIGLLVGTITGLIPGIHINLVGVFLLSLSTSLFFSINPIYMVFFIVFVAITHTFVDFIPSVFLGCPDTDTELSVLPGHQLLKSGQGQEALCLLTCLHRACNGGGYHRPKIPVMGGIINIIICKLQLIVAALIFFTILIAILDINLNPWRHIIKFE